MYSINNNYILSNQEQKIYYLFEYCLKNKFKKLKLFRNESFFDNVEKVFYILHRYYGNPIPNLKRFLNKTYELLSG